MQINYRVSYGFTKLTEQALVGFSLNVQTCLTGNEDLDDPPISPAAIGTAALALSNAIVAAQNGGPMQTAEKNEVKKALLAILRQDASYVQTMAGTNLPVLLSSGYSATSTNRARVPLAKSVIVSVDNQSSGLLVLNLQPLVNSRAFEVQLKNGTGGFATVGIYAYARRIVLPDLTPGQSYSVQARAIGGSTGYGEWSDVATRIVT